jgi:regulator of replication initiation timing
MLLQALAEIAQLKLENTKLQAENAELRRRLGMNSSNSHKPPSSDGYKKISSSTQFNAPFNV